MLNQTARTESDRAAAAVNVAMVTRVTRAQRRAACRQILGGVLTTDVVGIIVDHLGIKETLRLCATSKEMCGSEIVLRRLWTKAFNVVYDFHTECKSLIKCGEEVHRRLMHLNDDSWHSFTRIPWDILNNESNDAIDAKCDAERTMIRVFDTVKDTLPEVDQIKFAEMKSLTHEADALFWVQVPFYESRNESNVAEEILIKETNAVGRQSCELWEAFLTV